jgi:hypothetical protein
MSVDTERRSVFDRCKQTSISGRIFARGNGNRSTIRQQENEGHIFFIGQYSPVLLGTIVAVLFVWVVDALLNYIY